MDLCRTEHNRVGNISIMMVDQKRLEQKKYNRRYENRIEYDEVE